jgi:phage repressor protein C with HTH and peptisase S24 domain
MNPHQHKALVARLRALMERAQINARELAEQAGVGRSFVYDILSGKSSNPTTQKLSAIAEVLDTSVNYLLSGEENIGRLRKKDPEIVSIPSIGVTGSMGGGTVVTEEQEGKSYYFQRRWVREKLQASPADLRLIPVSGDSMHPTLQDGDLVLVDMSRRTPAPPGIFVLFDGVGLVVKRLEILPNTDPHLLRITSDNPQYACYERASNEVNIVGRVVWFARTIS